MPGDGNDDGDGDDAVGGASDVATGVDGDGDDSANAWMEMPGFCDVNNFIKFCVLPVVASSMLASDVTHHCKRSSA